MTFAKFKVEDNAQGQLLVGISSVVGTLTLKAGEGLKFPAFGVGETAIGTLESYSGGVVVKMEKVLITGKSGDAFTITRGYDGSTAQSFSSDDYFSIYPVAKVIEDIQDEVTRLETDKLDIDDFIAGADLYATSATGNDSYVVTMPKITSLAQINGQAIRVKVDVAKTSLATLNINGFGAKSIVKFGGTALDTNDIRAGQIMILIWDNAQDVFELKDALDLSTTIISRNFVDDTFYAGEAVNVGQAVFIEPGVTFALSTALQNIGDVVTNTRVAIPIFGAGVNFTTLQLALRKFVSPSVDLGVRIETDNAGSPSGTTVTNGTASVTSASLTTSLVNTTITFPGNVNLTIGQRFWIVLFAGTYGSETINATNYFAVGYNNTINTSTRRMMARNASTWSSINIPSITDDDNLTLPNGTNDTLQSGYRLQANRNIRLLTVNKNAGSNATRVIIKNDAGTILTTQSFIGNVATLASPQVFLSGTFFRVEVDNNGSLYTGVWNGSPTYPQVRTNVTYNTGSQGGANNTGAHQIDSVITEELNQFMPYVSSGGILDNILSLTDPAYLYKMQYYGISNDTVAVGGLPKIVVDGFYTGSGFVKDALYYLSATPGNLTTTPPTNVAQIGQGVAPGKLYVGGYYKEQRIVQAIVSNELRTSADVVKQTLSNTATKVKEIRMRISGNIRVDFDMKKDSNPAITARGQVYINGVAVGVLQSTNSSSYITYTENFYVKDGDLVQLFVSLASTGSAPDYGTYRNFRIYYSKAVIGRETDTILD